MSDYLVVAFVLTVSVILIVISRGLEKLFIEVRYTSKRLDKINYGLDFIDDKLTNNNDAYDYMKKLELENKDLKIKIIRYKEQIQGQARAIVRLKNDNQKRI